MLAMVMTAYMMVQESAHSNIEGAHVVMLGDNVSAVTWANKCGGTRDSRAVFLMRYLGRREMRPSWCFEAAHIPGVKNVLDDGMSRCPRKRIGLLVDDVTAPRHQSNGINRGLLETQ